MESKEVEKVLWGTVPPSSVLSLFFRAHIGKAAQQSMADFQTVIALENTVQPYSAIDRLKII